MNNKLYDAALKLSTKELAKNRGAFFGSIIGTLNHWMPSCFRLSTNCMRIGKLWITYSVSWRTL
ncbi:MAG: hypothetical protein Q8Q54_05300 [Methylococcales bacterium]|nr:hypothetical protein [Methylococcales bacterium]MDP3838320.1 hypothetical protein [Methylococcales bacterium]